MPIQQGMSQMSPAAINTIRRGRKSTDTGGNGGGGRRRKRRTAVPERDRMLTPGESHEVPPEAARAPVETHGENVGERVCRVCARPLRKRQQHVCSGRCRAAWSRSQRRKADAEQRRQIRALLTEAFRLLDEAIPG
jgi:predicted nucleic acid-binding Zn ribbon protein